MLSQTEHPADICLRRNSKHASIFAIEPGSAFIADQGMLGIRTRRSDAGEKQGGLKVAHKTPSLLINGYGQHRAQVYDYRPQIYRRCA